jgi:cellulose synthase operon protein C
MTTTAEDLQQLERLYEHGQYLTAYEQSKNWGPIETWSDPDAAVLGGKLANNLGAPRFCRWVHYRLWKQFPTHPEVVYYGLWAHFGRKGPLYAIRLDEVVPLPHADSVVSLADRYAMRCHFYSALRDFESGEKWLDLALDLCPERAWIHVERASFLLSQDKREDALEAARKALELQPFFRPAVQMYCYMLVQENQDDEAIRLLKQASEKIQSGDVAGQLLALYYELEQYDLAWETLDRVEQLYVLGHRDKGTQKFLRSRRSDLCFVRGDYESSIELAEKIDSPYYKVIAENLKQHAADGKRVKLDMEFVRQHHVTCAPATLSAISTYWKQPAQHLDIVEDICYDGTPAHEERRWAEEQGYFVQEFKVTWDNARQLLDAGFPFTLTTVGPNSAHLQPVIGYDSRRGILLIRDPGERHQAEYLAEKMLEFFNSTGPRGLAFVPAEKKDELVAMQLEDAQIYDLNYQLQLALKDHDRAKAYDCYRQMKQLDRKNRLTIYARATIAWYDADRVKLLECTEQLLEMFPDDINQLNQKLRLLGELGRKKEQNQLLKDLCYREKSDASYWQLYAVVLNEDARRQKEAGMWLRRAFRHRPVDERNFSIMADMRWEQQQRDEAIQLYRFAACIEDRNEGYARGYFLACHFHGMGDEALRFLKDRFARFGKKSAWPGRTLVNALESAAMTNEAMNVLKTALELRPEDGDLMLYASSFYGRYGDANNEQKFLELARGKTSRTEWLWAMLVQAQNHGRNNRAIKCVQEILRREPLNVDAHRIYAGLLADFEGVDKAESHLREAVKKFPYHYEVLRLLIEHLKSEDKDEAAEKEIRQLLRLHPDDPWAVRTLSLCYAGKRQYESALKLATKVIDIEPSDPSGYQLAGQFHLELGNKETARDFFQKALKISVDWEHAIHALIEMCDTKSQRVEALAFIKGELENRPSTGEGVLAYREVANSGMESSEVLDDLKSLARKHKNSWQCYIAILRQLIVMDLQDDAVKFCKRTTARFPLIPQVWMEAAVIHRMVGDSDSEISALKKARAMAPGWTEPIRELAEAYVQKDDLETAEQYLNEAINHEPRDVQNLCALADLQWRRDEQDEAIETITDVLKREPGLDLAWSKLTQWCDQIEQFEKPISVCKEIAANRPHDTRPWLMIANYTEDRLLFKNECESALEKAISLEPRNVDIHCQKARMLAAEGELDKALQACHPVHFDSESRPMQLRIQEAEIVADHDDLDKGMAMIQTALQDDPEYFYAWKKLAEWYEMKDDVTGYENCAMQMMRISPINPLACAYMGDAHLKRNRIEQAKEFFRRAIDIYPEYTFPTNMLIEIAMDQQDYATAREILDSPAGQYLEKVVHASQNVRLGARSGSQVHAGRSLHELCNALDDDMEVALRAIGDMADQGMGDVAWNIVCERFRSANSPRLIGELWAHCAVQFQQTQMAATALVQTASNREAWRDAAAYFIIFAGTFDPQSCDYVIQNLSQQLRAHNHTWHAVGRYYHERRRDPRAAIEWMGDWQHRPEPLLVDCQALVHSLVETRQYVAAFNVLKFAQEQNSATEEPNSLFEMVALEWQTRLGFIMIPDLGAVADAARSLDPSFVFADFHISYYQSMMVLANLFAPTDNAQALTPDAAIKLLDEIHTHTKANVAMDSSDTTEYAIYLNRWKWRIFKEYGKWFRAWICDLMLPFVGSSKKDVVTPP